MKEKYTLNTFITLPKNNHAVVTLGFNTPDTQVSFKNILLKVGIWAGFDQLQDSMDRLLEQYNRESARNTMLKHEEIFKQQVHELHRIYRVQKMLMAELRNKEVITDTKTRFWSTTSTSESSHSSYVSNKHHSTAQLNTDYSSLKQYNIRPGPSLRELNICSEDPLRKQRGFNLEQPAEEDTAIEVSANQDQTLFQKHSKEKTSIEGPDSWTDGETIELTLSIGCGANKKKPKHWLHPDIELGCSTAIPSETRQLVVSTPVRLDRGEECSEPSTSFDRESLQRPSWPFQAMSMSR